MKYINLAFINARLQRLAVGVKMRGRRVVFIFLSLMSSHKSMAPINEEAAKSQRRVTELNSCRRRQT